MHNALNNCVNVAKKTCRATHFFMTFLQSPLRVGSICPSSDSLVSTLIQQATMQTDGLVIDLGAGSGAVSSKLIKAGVNSERILAVEVSSRFKNAFTKRCPTVALAIGDARELHTIVNNHSLNKPVSLIISSIPFRSLPEILNQQIANTLQAVMEEHHCQLVQYSYAWWMQYPLKKYGFLPQDSKFVMKNVPPARVEWYNV